MSEEILKALVQLFAIITKQDFGVTEKERQYVIDIFTQKLNKDSVKEYVTLYDELVGYGIEKDPASDGKKLTSVKDSVRMLSICKKINKTLTQTQKIIVLQELLELIYSDKQYTEKRKEIIDTIALAFNIIPLEFEALEKFVLSEDGKNLNFESILVIAQENIVENGINKFIKADENVKGVYLFYRIASVDMCLYRYFGNDTSLLNGIKVLAGDTILFPKGGSVKTQSGTTFFYSDIVANFLSDVQEVKLSFNALDLEYRFPNKKVGLTDIHISEGAGKLIAIMGASGAGKTTLLNVLSGLEKPSKGSICINGIDIYTDKQSVEGLMGYIPQDDLLIEDLTVFENLYYSAKLCFGEYTNAEIVERVNKTLYDLGLHHIRGLKVGNSLNKSISGGQRKRLNIALELIREPAVLFVDEPTSGLSSRDSENVIDLLKELSYKGKLIFVVIHQPSSDIYKMFDKIILLDTGGYQIFYGNPVQAISYFKEMTMHTHDEGGFCISCGNVNPESMFTIIEEQVVDEFGQFTGVRKTNPIQWYNAFKEKFIVKPLQDLLNVKIKVPLKTSRIKQFGVFITRDVKAKFNNTQYVVINLLEAPILAFVLAFVIRYNNTASNSEYIYRNNDNISAFILMSIVVALFMGLSVSAEEIIKDKKILKREEFLNLSRGSYLSSKVLILFSLSAIQMLLFVWVGNSILEIKGMYFSYWVMLFSVSCGANLIGLNASSTFNSAITVYILIPILLIPQMILSGAMFNFDKINDIVKNKAKVPLIADAMISRWAYEGLSVYQFSENKYGKRFFKIEQVEQTTLFNIVFGIPHMRSGLDKLKDKLSSKTITNADKEEYYYPVLDFVASNYKMLEMTDEDVLKFKVIFKDVRLITIEHLQKHLLTLDERMNVIYNLSSVKEDKLVTALDKKFGEGYTLKLKDEYYNESLADNVRNLNTTDKVAIYRNHMIPKTEYVYFNPIYSEGVFDYRSHIFSPTKKMFNQVFPTYWFNVIVIWFMILIMYVMLYFDFYTKVFVGVDRMMNLFQKK